MLYDCFILSRKRPIIPGEDGQIVALTDFCLLARPTIATRVKGCLFLGFSIFTGFLRPLINRPIKHQKIKVETHTHTTKLHLYQLKGYTKHTHTQAFFKKEQVEINLWWLIWRRWKKSLLGETIWLGRGTLLRDRTKKKEGQRLSSL